MEQQDAKLLWEKYKARLTSPEEEQLLLKWLQSINQDAPLNLNEEELEQVYTEMEHYISKLVAPKPLYAKLWPYATGLAAAVAAIIFGIWFFSPAPSLEERSARIAASNDIPPEPNKVTLTLESGETIPLSGTKDGIVIGSSGLKYTDSTSVAGGNRTLVPKTGNEKMKMLTIKARYGSTYTLILPDGSKIWLNTASTLKFPSTFNKLNTRTVELRGEAYFEIAKNVAKPFIVQSGQQVITVLGTHFNVNTYDYGAEVKTTLLEGSVQVNLLQEPDQKKILKPGEQASSSKRTLRVDKANTEAVMAWKRGDFVFVDDDLETILQRLKNWYDVEFRYVGKKPNLKMTGIMSRKATLSKVLAIIEASGKVKFKIEGRKVYVMN